MNSFPKKNRVCMINLNCCIAVNFHSTINFESRVLSVTILFLCEYNLCLVIYISHFTVKYCNELTLTRL